MPNKLDSGASETAAAHTNPKKCYAVKQISCSNVLRQQEQKRPGIGEKHNKFSPIPGGFQANKCSQVGCELKILSWHRLEMFSFGISAWHIARGRSPGFGHNFFDS